MMRPIDADLNRAIMLLAPRFEARDVAPETFQGLLNGPRGLVWAGASDATIYADARVNWAMRAWHDGHHIAGMHDFSLAGERAACEAQCRELLLLYPRAPMRWLTILRAEVIGQAEHYAETGAFPVDQYAFTMNLIKQMERT